MGRSFDVIVVGAGIVGAACAREFTEAGLRVAVCDAGDFPGGGATAAGMGHIAVMDDSAAQFALTAYSQKLWAELAPRLPPDSEYLTCGSLWVAADEEEQWEVDRKFHYYSQRGIAVERLDERQLAEAEPHLRRGLAGALLMHEDSVCYPPCVARYLMGGGGEFVPRSVVMEANDAGVRLRDGQQLAAGAVVLATGAAARQLAPEIELHPRKGHLAITERYPGMVRHQLIELGYLKSAHGGSSDSVAFNAQPRVTGQILIGSSRQYGVEDPVIEPATLSRMLAQAMAYMPGLSALSIIRTWTGFRAATPDKLPLIGLCPGFRNVYLATGHEGLGISTSLGTAKLLADRMLQRSPAIAPEPYEPSRSFAIHA